VKRQQLRFGKGFRVALTNARTQAAMMVIPPGDAEGGPRNRHRGADQWLFVVEGSGQAFIKGKRHALRRGTLLLIEHGAVSSLYRSRRERPVTGLQPSVTRRRRRSRRCGLETYSQG